MSSTVITSDVMAFNQVSDVGFYNFMQEARLECSLADTVAKLLVQEQNDERTGNTASQVFFGRGQVTGK